MFCGPAWIRLRSSSMSLPRRLWSYATSSGPKQRSHTYNASRGYSLWHSLHLRCVTATEGSFHIVFAGEPCGKDWKPATHLSGIGTCRSYTVVVGGSLG